MTVELVYKPRLAEYRLSDSHPLRPERFVLAVELMRAWGLICDASAENPACATLVSPEKASDADVLAVHTAGYVDAVKAAGANPGTWHGDRGIGPGDTPAFAHMHEISAEIAGATMRALSDVVEGRCQRSFSPAGGLHHAHRDHASGFCVYNDPAIAICHALSAHPDLRIAYVDVDVHHGDGVQDVFYEQANVLTISVHESGRFLFPGTGRLVETGVGAGTGFAVNLPLAPGAGDDSYGIAFETVIAPAVRAFSPDVIVAQLGADSHRADPLAHLDTTVWGQYHIATRMVALADEVCGGRIAATGGGGYDSFSAVPRAWACALAALLGVPVPEELPDSWRMLAVEAAERAGVRIHLPISTFGEAEAPRQPEWGGDPLAETERAIVRLRAQHPLLHDR